MEFSEVEALRKENPQSSKFIRNFVGAHDSIHGISRFCLWILDSERNNAYQINGISERLERVRDMRDKSPKVLTKRGAITPHTFQQIRQTGDEVPIVIPRHSSEARLYLPISLYPKGTIVADGAFAIFDSSLWNMALILSHLHLVWIAAVCGKIKTDYRYSSTLGWNTFPVPTLTEKNKTDLTHCAEDILLARESHFPATIADLYNPENMPANLRAAHERNDEVLERIYIGRRFRNDTERLEKLFDLYTKMTAATGTKAQPAAKATKGKKVS